jgi:hypothetical protein
VRHPLEIKLRQIVNPASYPNLMTHDYSPQIILGSSLGRPPCLVPAIYIATDYRFFVEGYRGASYVYTVMGTGHTSCGSWRRSAGRASMARAAPVVFAEGSSREATEGVRVALVGTMGS